MEKTTRNTFYGINKFCDALKQYEKYNYIGVYFKKHFLNMYNEICIKPIGYTLTDENNKTIYIRYYDINKYVSDLRYIKFKPTKERIAILNQGKINELDNLYRLMISTKSKELKGVLFDGFGKVYHDIKIIKADYKLLDKLEANYKEDIQKILSEKTDDFDDLINVEDPEI